MLLRAMSQSAVYEIEHELLSNSIINFNRIISLIRTEKAIEKKIENLNLSLSEGYK